MPSFIYLGHFDSDSHLAYLPTDKTHAAMSISKTSTQVSYESIKPSINQRVVDHCKRFWWLHLILWIFITVLIVCLSIFVFVPLIAQKKVDAVDLEIQGVNILDTKPHSFLVQINATIKSDGQVKADIDPFEGTLTLADTPNAEPFMRVKFPASNAAKFQAVNISQHVDIVDTNAFQDFNRVFFRNETLKVKMSGRTTVQPAGLNKKYPINFSKTLEFKGLNGLKGTEIENVKFDFDQDGARLDATAVITNPSYYTLEIGNATFQNFADELRIGNLTITDFFLRPGQNIVPITARIDLTKVLQVVKRPAHCKQGTIPFKLQVTDVQNHGQNISWLASSLSSANQTVDINLAAVLGSAGGASFCD